MSYLFYYPPGAVWEKIPAAAEEMAAFCCRRPRWACQAPLGRAVFFGGGSLSRT